MTKFDKIAQIMNLFIVVLSVLFVIGLTYSGVWLSAATWVFIGLNAAMNYRVLLDLNKSNDGE